MQLQAAPAADHAEGCYTGTAARLHDTLRVLSLQGKRLLALGQADLYQLVDTKLDADLLADAIQDLRLRAVGALCTFTSKVSGPCISHYSCKLALQGQWKPGTQEILRL